MLEIISTWLWCLPMTNTTLVLDYVAGSQQWLQCLHTTFASVCIMLTTMPLKTFPCYTKNPLHFPQLCLPASHFILLCIIELARCNFAVKSRRVFMGHPNFSLSILHFWYPSTVNMFNITGPLCDEWPVRQSFQIQGSFKGKGHFPQFILVNCTCVAFFTWTLRGKEFFLYSSAYFARYMRMNTQWRHAGKTFIG